MIERLAGLPAEIDLGSEFRYRDAIVGPETLVVAVSQSGETADTLGAVKAARQKGCPILAITNVVGSALSREATGDALHARRPRDRRGVDQGVLDHGRGQLSAGALARSAARHHQRRGPAQAHPRTWSRSRAWSSRRSSSTARSPALARHLSHAPNFLYLGRGLQYPIALEGALKLKELSYIHAEGYAGGEMKHGPIALISDGFPVVALAPRDSSYERMLGNIEEVRAREGQVIAVVQPGDKMVASKAQHVIEVPAAAELLAPLITVVPLQLLAYHIAVRRGCDVDQPRNLAKSVTVE